MKQLAAISLIALSSFVARADHSLEKFAIEGMYTLEAIKHEGGLKEVYSPLNLMTILRRLDVKDRESYVVALIVGRDGASKVLFNDTELRVEGTQVHINAESMIDNRMPAVLQLSINSVTGEATGSFYDSVGAGYKSLRAQRFKSLGYLVPEKIPPNLPREEQIQGIYRGTWLRDMNDKPIEGILLIRRFPSGNFAADFRTLEGRQIVSELVNGKYIAKYGLLMFGSHQRGIFSKLSLRFQPDQIGEMILAGCSYATNGGRSSAEFRRVGNVENP